MNSIKKLILSSIYLIFFVTSTPVVAFQQSIDTDHPFGIFYEDDVAVELKQNVGVFEVLFDIPEEHYLYREKFELSFDQDGIQGKMMLPAGEKKYDEFLSKEAELFYNQLVVPVEFQVSDAFQGQGVTGQIKYQGCSGKICYRAMTLDFQIPIKMMGATKKVVQKIQVPVEVKHAQEEKSLLDYLAAAQFEEILKRGLLFSMLIAFLAGLFTSFTPCVLPVIPLTLTFMGVSKKQKKWDKVFSLIIFVFGMALMYSSLGLLSAFLGKTLGFWFQSFYFQVFLIVFFLSMALWMFGLIDLNLVSSEMQTRLARYQPQGHFRQLYSGLTIGFLAAPCVGPVTGPMLVYISATQDLKIGFLLMLAYALGLSVLFFVLGFVSSNWVRHFGERSNWIKKLLGVLLLLTACFYIYGLAKPYLANQQDSFFMKSLTQAEEIAKNEKKGVIIDFFADWCVPCHKWDKLIWNHEDMQEVVLQDYVPVKIDCTLESKECDETDKRFGVVGMPTVIFLDANLKEIKGTRIVGRLMDKKEFLEHLKKAKKQRVKTE